MSATELSRRLGLRASKKERTRAALVEAALALTADRGYEAATVEEIAGAADVSVRTFHNYFRSKAALFVDHALAMITELGEHLAAQPDTLSCTDAMSGAWADMLEAHSGHLDRLRILLETLETQPEVRERIKATAPGSADPIREDLARRLGEDPATSVAASFGVDLFFFAPAWVIGAQEEICAAPLSPVPTLEDTGPLLHAALSSFAALSAPPDPKDH